MTKRSMAVAALLATTGLATTVTPALADESASSEAMTCGSMHLIMANGTGDSNDWRDPNQDQGFFSQLSTYVLDKAATGDIPFSTDRSGGIAESLSPVDKDTPADQSRSESTSTKTAPKTDTSTSRATTTSTTESDSGDKDTSTSSATSSAATTTDKDDADTGDDTRLQITRTFVPYPSAAGGMQFVQSQGAAPSVSYTESVNTGIEAAEEQIAAVNSECPDAAFFLTGYSQGAEVIDAVARKIGAGKGAISADRVAGVSLFAAPTRQAGTPLSPDGRDSVSGELASDVVSGLNGYTTPAGGGISADKTGIDSYGALEDRTVSWCLNGDMVCGLPVDSEIARGVVTALEGVDVTDPQATLRQMADGLNQALAVNDVEKIAPTDVDFGKGGFSLSNSGYGAVKDTSSNKALSADTGATMFEKFVDKSISTSEALGSRSSTLGGSDVLGSLTNPDKQESKSGSADSEALSRGADAASAAGDTALSELGDSLAGSSTSRVDRSNSIEWRLLNAGSELGGMAMGAGISTLRKTLTPENLAQTVMAGVTGGPQAAAAIAGVQFSKAGLELLDPKNASIMVKDGMKALRDSGLGIADISELAVALSSWKSLDEHSGYTTRAMLPDGRTALDATRDWVLAAASDSGADVTDSDDDPNLAALKAASEDDGETVTVDRDKLAQALAEVNQRSTEANDTEPTTESKAATTSESATATATETNNNNDDQQESSTVRSSAAVTKEDSE